MQTNNLDVNIYAWINPMLDTLVLLLQKPTISTTSLFCGIWFPICLREFQKLMQTTFNHCDQSVLSAMAFGPFVRIVVPLQHWHGFCWLHDQRSLWHILRIVWCSPQAQITMVAGGAIGRAASNSALYFAKGSSGCMLPSQFLEWAKGRGSIQGQFLAQHKGNLP